MTVVPSPRARRAAGIGGAAAEEEFAQQIADALGYLHDVPRLQTHRLARRIGGSSEPTDGLGRALQQTLLDAIEKLRPARHSSPERSARIHRLLVSRYIDGLEPSTVWALLGIGKSEYYREHSRGVDAVASLLWERLDGNDRRARAQASVETDARLPLPRPLTTFVGRKHELTDLHELLRQARLVTLSGPPGTGKTRLALRIVERIRPAFADGAIFVPLASVSAPELVVPAVLLALGLKEQSGRPALDQLIDALLGCELLLALDNFEHVIAAAPQVAALLAGCPRLRMLVTSRELLRISGEYAYSVAPLEDHDAVQLFGERARAARADFALTTENAAAVAAICARVDRLPLAIELAAGRVRLFGPAALLVRLEHRLPLLSGGPRDLPPRQQALRETIAWSYDLLDAAEQALFCQLAVCVGGCTVETIEALFGGEVLDGVGSLVEKSLVLQEPGLGGEPRFWMLETIREYALERLEECGEGAAARRTHAAYFRELAERAEIEYCGPLEREWLDRLDQEYANLRAAVDWSLGGGEPEVGLALTGALWRFLYHRDHLTEGRALLRRLVAAATPAAPSQALAKGLFAAASLAVWQGESAAGRSDAEASVALWRALGDKRGEAQALHTLGHTSMDHATERDLYAESVARFREAGDLRGLAWSLQCLGNVMVVLGELDGAHANYVETLAVARRGDSPAGIGWGLTGLGNLATRRGDHAAAYRFYLEGFEVRRSASDRAVTNQLNLLGRAALGMGDANLAATHFRESLEMCRKQSIKWDAAFALTGLAEVALGAGDPLQAARLYAAADALLAALGERRSAADQAEHERKLRAVNDTLGESAFQQASAFGRAMTRDEAIASALNER